MLDLSDLRPKGARISNNTSSRGAWDFYDRYAELTYKVNTMSVKFDWTDGRGVPISDAQRDKYAEKLVKYLQDNPDETWTYTATGDMFMFAMRDESGNIEIEDLIPKRWSFIENGKVVDGSEVKKCFCDMKTLMQTGCQCGGT